MSEEKITDKEMVKLPFETITSELALQVVRKVEEQRRESLERGDELLHVYIGTEIFQSFKQLLHESREMEYRLAMNPEEMKKLYEVGPTFTYSGIGYFVVQVTNHLYFAIKPYDYGD